MSERVGYARCGLDKQDFTAQREILLGLDVPEDRIYLDHGLTGTNRDRPGLAEALAAVRAGDTRRDYESLTYKVCDPPPAVTRGVLAMLDTLGLPYGAFDFVITPAGAWVMLELNPSGQYGFVEQATGLPITAAIADHLEGVT